jgi:hypothetical protein
MTVSKRPRVDLINDSQEILKRIQEATPFTSAPYIVWLMLCRYEQDFIESTNKYLRPGVLDGANAIHTANTNSVVTDTQTEPANQLEPTTADINNKVFEDQDF